MKILILIAVIVLGAGGFLLYSRMQNSAAPATPASTATTTPNTPTPVATTPTVSCTPAQGEAAFSGKVAYLVHGQSGQYTLQASGGTTYYLRTNDAQAATLKNKLNMAAQVNGTLVAPNSSDVNVTTVCP